MAIYEKMINEALGATKAVFGVIKEKRGGEFKITDCKPYVDAVNTMTAACFLQSKNPHFCKQKSPVEGGEFLTI